MGLWHVLGHGGGAEHLPDGPSPEPAGSHAEALRGQQHANTPPGGAKLKSRAPPSCSPLARHVCSRFCVLVLGCSVVSGFPRSGSLLSQMTARSEYAHLSVWHLPCEPAGTAGKSTPWDAGT